MGNYNTTISKRAQNANNIIISTLSSTTSKTTTIDNNNNNDNYEFINDPSLNDYDNSHYNSDNNNIISNVNNMKTSLINSAKIKLQDTLNDIATTATNLNNNQNNNYNGDTNNNNNNNNNELIFDNSDIDTTINDSIYMKPITTTITTIIDTHHNNLVGGNSGLLQKLGRGLSSNEVNMIRNHVTSHHGSNGNTFTSPHNANTLLNDYGSNSLNSAMVNIQNHDNLMKQMEYDKFMNEIWIGIVLTLIVISLVFCICSCFLYHQFRQWKRNYRQNCQRNYDIESVKLNVEDDDPVPNYTLVSGLPSYEAALELLRNSSSTTTSPSSLSTTRLLPLSSGSNCINSSDTTATTTPTTLLPAPPYTPPVFIGTQSTSPPSIFHVFGTIHNDNQNSNINSNSNSNMNSNNSNNDNSNNLKELSNSCEKIVIPIIHRSSDNHHQQQHHQQQQQQEQLQCQQQDDTNTTEIINCEDYQTSEKNLIKSNEICNNINLSDELNSDTKTHH